jgi:ArsR family transcriptional regulator, arsenate/arsenite/antimonite-responsive transcriptional repressor
MREYSRIFKALSDETRLRIMALVFRHGAVCVCEVEQILGVTQSKASRHMRYLRDAGVLEDRREGVTVYYGVPAAQRPEIAAVLMLLRGLLAGSRHRRRRRCWWSCGRRVASRRTPSR